MAVCNLCDIAYSDFVRHMKTCEGKVKCDDCDGLFYVKDCHMSDNSNEVRHRIVTYTIVCNNCYRENELGEEVSEEESEASDCDCCGDESGSEDLNPGN